MTRPARQALNGTGAIATADRILDAAEALAQTRGFNGFSYGDLARIVGLTTASLHYHFPSKAELGRRLMARYTERFGHELEGIRASRRSAPESLEQYARLFVSVVRDERICLCGMLAAEYATLPGGIQDEVRRFFDLNEAWLAEAVAEGQEAGTLATEGSPLEIARLLIGALEGAMLVARSYNDPDRFEATARRTIAAFAPRAADG